MGFYWVTFHSGSWEQAAEINWSGRRCNSIFTTGLSAPLLQKEEIHCIHELTHLTSETPLFHCIVSSFLTFLSFLQFCHIFFPCTVCELQAKRGQVRCLLTRWQTLDKHLLLQSLVHSHLHHHLAGIFLLLFHCYKFASFYPLLLALYFLLRQLLSSAYSPLPGGAGLKEANKLQLYLRYVIKQNLFAKYLKKQTGKNKKPHQLSTRIFTIQGSTGCCMIIGALNPAAPLLLCDVTQQHGLCRTAGKELMVFTPLSLTWGDLTVAGFFGVDTLAVFELGVSRGLLGLCGTAEEGLVGVVGLGRVFEVLLYFLAVTAVTASWYILEVLASSLERMLANLGVLIAVQVEEPLLS